MAQKAPDPHAKTERDIDDSLNSAKMDEVMEKYKDAPMMMQLCKIAEEKERQEKQKKGSQHKGQDRDPRVPYDVLVEEGISPNPGPHEERLDALRAVAPCWDTRRASPTQKNDTNCRKSGGLGTKWILGVLAMALANPCNAISAPNQGLCPSEKNWKANQKEGATNPEPTKPDCGREEGPARYDPLWGQAAGLSSDAPQHTKSNQVA